MSDQVQIDFAPSLRDLPTTALVVVPVFEGSEFFREGEVAAIVGDRMAAVFPLGSPPGKLYSGWLLHGSHDAPTLYFLGAGDRDRFSSLDLMRWASAAARALLPLGYTHLAFLDPAAGDAVDFGRSVVEGALRGAYDGGLRQTKKPRAHHLHRLSLIGAEAELRTGAALGKIVGETNSIARDLVNLPPNDLTPSDFAERAQALAAENGLQCEILDEQSMRELGMGAFLGVSAGSAEPARLIVLRHGNADAAIKLAFVGKGLTFDSGGLSIKPAQGMETMKHDMGGGAAVVAGMVAIARLGLEGLSITGYVGATENMPGGKAMRPGDVLTAMNGETIEVLNTDAEGRLVLADLLSYAKQQGATHIVDFATLTGGAMVALGTTCSLAAGRPDQWVQDVVDAAGLGLERAWRMPLFPEYRQAMDSDVADIKNTGGRYASALTAAAFLSDFAEGVEWAHIDIAGTAWADESAPYRAKGATGEGVGTIVSVAQRLSQGKETKA